MRVFTKKRVVLAAPVAVSLGLLLSLAAESGAQPLIGINYPPQQGTSGAGAFAPGIYNWTYTPAAIAASLSYFNAMRWPINVATAENTGQLYYLQNLINQFPGANAIICMFETSSDPHNPAGLGYPTDKPGMIQAWRNIQAVFGGMPNVHYEIYNEPFGYQESDPSWYVTDMLSIIDGAGLPHWKCILDGMGHAQNINLVASGGWTGDMAIHLYPFFSSQTTQEGFSVEIQTQLSSWGQNCYVTEFGADLRANIDDGYNDIYGCFDTYSTGNSQANFLRGMDDALRALKATGHGVKGTFFWHGWDNNDTYDFWDAQNADGACKVETIQRND